MGFELPDTCGYVSGSGNAFLYHEELEQGYVIYLQNMYGANPSPEYLLKNGTKAIDDLYKYGITEDQVIAAAKRTFGLDINTLYSMNIPADVLLPWSHLNSINLKQIDALNTFVESGDPESSSSFNAQTESGRLTTALESGRDVNKHYSTVDPLLKPGSVEANIAERVHDKYLYGAREAIKAVEQKGGNISNALQSDLFNTNPTQVISLDETQDLAPTKFDLDDPKRGIKSIVPPRSLKG